MVSTVTARPNHYEVLGLTPGATDEEIRQAFAREISVLRPRAFGGMGDVSLAYETLRNPAKRKAYDASIGIRPEPKPIAPLYSLSGRAPVAQFAGSTIGARLERLAREEVQPTPAPEVRPRTPAEARTASFIASSLRSPADVQPSRDPPPVQRPPVQSPPRPEAQTRPEPRPVEEQAVRPARQLDHFDVEEAAFEWRRPAGIAGALLLAVGMIGAWAGWEAGNDMPPDQLPKPSVTNKLPPPPEFPVPAREAVAPVASAVSRIPEVARRAPRAAAPVERPSAPRNYVALAEEPAEPVQTATATLVEAVAAEPEAAAMVPAAMPLPHSVVARTIGRIGYSCGQVASASAVDGKAGVFKVTCTSGDSYRAAPVRGRYHFSRWAKN